MHLPRLCQAPFQLLQLLLALQPCLLQTEARRRFEPFSLRMRSQPRSRQIRRDNEGFSVPAANQGSQLTFVFNTFPAGLGEPLNVIISSTSDAAILKNQATNGGLLNYFQSIGFSTECLGQHIGDHQQADLGDGHGRLNETAVMRWDYGDPSIGTCRETFEGGNHLRYWIQNGPAENTGAIFMAVSYEQSASAGHDVVFNGYNLGRDELIGNATAQSSAPPTESYTLNPVPNTASTTNSTSNNTISSTSTSTIPVSTSTTPVVRVASSLPSFAGKTSANNYTYQTTSTYLTGLLSNTSDGINHAGSVQDPDTGNTAIDGLVAVLEVKIVERPADASGTTSINHRKSFRWRILLVSLIYLFSAL